MLDDLDPRPGPPSGLRVMGRAECLALLESQQVGRLVYVDRALPDVFPVNYRLDGDGVLVRLARGSRTAKAVLDSVVAFEADLIDAGSRSGWSVTMVGEASEVLDPDPGSDVETWVGDRRDLLVRIAASRLTGRQLLPGSAG